MISTADLIQHSSLAWLMATGLVLGGLHALEPGHAKTMMASFIVATRGTVPQAVLLGVCAALSHSLLIWVLAGIALITGNAFIGDDAEPWLQLGSGLVIVGIGASMAWRHARSLSAARHGHSDIGPQGGRLIDTGHGFAEIVIFEQGVPPQFQLFFYDAALRPADAPDAGAVTLRTVRPDGTAQTFGFVGAGLCLVSTTAIPEPHAFTAVLSLSHGDHAHDYDLAFTEHEHEHGHEHDHAHDHAHDHGHHHGHGHAHGQDREDAHARAHARQIRQRLAGGAVTTRQIALFGLSGGLMPCPAALTMLLVCLRLKKAALGVGLVTSFSLGLAVVLVTLGVVASIGVRHAMRHRPHFGRLGEMLPFVSSAIVVGIGLFMGVSGYVHLA